jgi:hypothetical protein
MAAMNNEPLIVIDPGIDNNMWFITFHDDCDQFLKEAVHVELDKNPNIHSWSTHSSYAVSRSHMGDDDYEPTGYDEFTCIMMRRPRPCFDLNLPAIPEFTPADIAFGNNYNRERDYFNGFSGVSYFDVWCDTTPEPGPARGTERRRS